MQYYEVKATLLTPCCISEQPAMGNEVETLDYIPGAALRGMLVDLYLRQAPADETFREIFCSDEISFPNLYPVGCSPWPLSAHVCKRQPGFLNDRSESLRHGVWDLLFEDAEGFSPQCRNRQHCDEGCAGPLKPHHKTWYSGEQVKPKSESGPRKLLVMRTAVDSTIGSALDRSLHSQQELPADATFTGTLTASDAPTLDRTKKLIESLIEKLGGSTNIEVTGYTGRRRAGRVRLRLLPASAPSKPRFFKTWPKPSQSDHCYFALTFASDVILVDQLLRPIITLDRQGNVLKDEMDFPRDVELTVEKAFVSQRRVSGWNAVAQIFKPDDMAMVMGSTFLVKVKEADEQRVTAWMQRVSEQGAGLRRAEGFGRVRFDEPLHRKAADEKGGPL